MCTRARGGPVEEVCSYVCSRGVISTGHEHQAPPPTSPVASKVPPRARGLSNNEKAPPSEEGGA